MKYARIHKKKYNDNFALRKYKYANILDGTVDYTFTYVRIQRINTYQIYVYLWLTYVYIRLHTYQCDVYIRTNIYVYLWLTYVLIRMCLK